TWFNTATLPTGFLYGFYGGSGVGLSTGGDAVTIFDAKSNQVTGIQFGAAPASAPFATFDNTPGQGSATLPLPTVSTLSAPGVNGAGVSVDVQEIGSPDGFPPAGVAPTEATAPVVVSEVAPWGSSNTPYAVDWIELTNTGSDTVNLNG